MSIKDLFSGKSNVISNKNLDDFQSEIKSTDLISLKRKLEQKIKPDIDFYVPSNFAKYGSAEEYYSNSIKKIHTTYPYDGSTKDKMEWQLSASYLDEWVLENIYPKERGGIYFDTNFGNYITLDATPAYRKYDSPKYVEIKGGPNVGNVYDTDTFRDDNLKISFLSGTCIQFWMNKEGIDPDSDYNNHEVVCSFRNHTNTSNDFNLECQFYHGVSVDTIYFYHENQFNYTSVSASLDFLNIGWNQYTWNWSYNSTLQEHSHDLYVNGVLKDTKKVSGTPTISNVAFVTGNIGSACYSSVPYLTESLGAGQLFDTYIDEFRVWKRALTSEEIGKNWFTQVEGGNNSEYNNQLGVYYKFNEGVTGTGSTDQIIVDYSGRNSDATFVGYISGSRTTGSAFIDFGLSEPAEPILYPLHRDVSSLSTIYEGKGREWDENNGNSIIKMIPSAIVEDDEESGHLKKLTQIIASYFDTAASQIEFLPKVFSTEYSVSGSTNSDLLLSLINSKGLQLDEIFGNSGIEEDILQKNFERTYDKSLSEIKSHIYRNVYNNLNYLYKSKGTNNSFRNLFRCFGVDDEQLKLNIYADGEDYEINADKRYQTSRRKNYLDLSGRSDRVNMESLVYQDWDGATSSSFGYLLDSATDEFGSGSALVAETTVVFPKQFPQYDPQYVFFPSNTLTGSVFGFHAPAETIHTTDTTVDNTLLNVQVLFWRKNRYSSDAKFALAVTGTVISETDYYPVFENTKWTFGLRVGTSGSYPMGDVLDFDLANRTISLYGVQEDSNIILNEFELSTHTLEGGADMALNNAKKFYLGAWRDNFTGSLVHPTECLYSNFRVYISDIDYDTIKDHARDPYNYGSKYAYRNVYNLKTKGNQEWNYSADSVALNWDFQNTPLTASSSTFTVDHFSPTITGSSTSNSWVKDVTTKNYIGTGFGFNTNSPVIERGYASIAQNRILENIHGIDTVKFVDDHNFGIDQHPSNYFYSIENSPYSIVSEEMLHFFASIEEFNNLIGEPINQYRMSYKGIDKLREIFFNKIINPRIEVDRYFEYYKWIDSAINNVVGKFFPASANSSERIANMIESHILERNKYKYPYALINGRAVKYEASATPSTEPANAVGSGLNLFVTKTVQKVNGVIDENKHSNIGNSQYRPIYKALAQRWRLSE